MGRTTMLRAVLMIGMQVALACGLLTFAGAIVSPNAMLAGFGIEMLTLYWIVGWLFWPARVAAQSPMVVDASDPTEEGFESASGQMKPIKLSVAFCSATE
jgi:hypothetical protein